MSPRTRSTRRPLLSRRRLALLLCALAVAVLAGTIERHARAVTLLLGLSGDRKLSVLEEPFGVETVEVSTELVSAKVQRVRARLYLPLPSVPFSGKPRGLVLAHGVHHLGIDEPRLVALSRAFAHAGVLVLTPELPALADYHVDDPGNLDVLRASVRYLAGRPEARPGGVGLLGISFAGGLALRVASEPGVDADLAFVASIGGHHDMQRVARFFVTDRVDGPDGELDWKAHDYGLAVLVLDAAEHFVSKEDVPHLRAAVRAFLHESYPAAHQAALAMTPQGMAVFDRVFHRDRLALGPQVMASLPLLAASMAAASPAGHVAAIRVPIFLLHGAHDDVVPPSESRWIAREARAPVRLLVSPKIGHAELGEAGVRDVAELVHFMADLLGA